MYLEPLTPLRIAENLEKQAQVQLGRKEIHKLWEWSIQTEIAEKVRKRQEL